MQNLIVVERDDLRGMIEEIIQNNLTSFTDTKKEDQSSDDELIKIQQVAELFGVSKVSVHAWKKAGKLPFYRISRKIYFKKSEVLEALKRGTR